MLRRSQYKDKEKFRQTRNSQKRRYYGKTKNAKNSFKRWTKEDVALVMEHKMLDSELSKLIGRSVSSIQAKRTSIKMAKES